MIGSPCDTGTAEAGILGVTYTPQPGGTASVSVVCNETTPQYELTVSFTLFNPPSTETAGVLALPPVGGIQCQVDASGTTTGNCSHFYPAGTTVTLHADTCCTVPGPSITWNGCTTYDGVDCIIIMDSPKKPVLTFGP